MAIVEVQIEESAFLGLLQSEFNRQRLPGPSLPLPGLEGVVLQRIRCDHLQLQDAGEVGHLGLGSTAVIEYNTSLAEVRAAGSMRLPATHELPLHPSLTVGVIVPTKDDTDAAPIVRATVEGLWPYDVPMAVPERFTVASGAMTHGDGAVALRLGTQATDPVHAPLVGRVGTGNWSQLVHGGVLAEVLTTVLSETLTAILSDRLLLEREPRGEWVGSSRPYAVASASLRAVTPLIDAVVDLQVVLTPEVVGRELQLTVRLTWSGRTGLEYLVDLFAPVFGRLILDEVLNAQVAKRLPGQLTQDGFKEIDRDDKSVTLRGSQPLEPPVEEFVLENAQVTTEGVVCTGPVRLRAPRRGMEAWMDRATYSLVPNCGARRVDVNFYPSRLWLRDLGVAGRTGPRVFYESVVTEPAGAWDIEPMPHGVWFETALTFTDSPSGRPATGTSTSAFVTTDCGTIWVDLGAVPPRPAEPSAGDIGRMLSSCLAISDPFGMGPLNLGWLIDPPDFLNPDDLVRDWSIRFSELPEGAVVTVKALDSETGSERVISTVASPGDHLIHLLTSPNEELILEAEGFEAPMPSVEQRWLESFKEIPTEVGSQVIENFDGVLAVYDSVGGTKYIDLATEAVVDESLALTRRVGGNAASARVRAVLDRQMRRHATASSAVVTELSPNTVALGMGTKLVIAKVRGIARLQ